MTDLRINLDVMVEDENGSSVDINYVEYSMDILTVQIDEALNTEDEDEMLKLLEERSIHHVELLTEALQGKPDFETVKEMIPEFTAEQKIDLFKHILLGA
jgi:hypothetical protein